MKQLSALIVLSSVALLSAAQVRFKTIVPIRPIAPGESFQVQYIIENGAEMSNFLAPQFQGFRVVAGPNTYADNKSPFHKNLVYTLTALAEGRFKVGGATCIVNGKLIKSNDVYVKIISVEDPGDSPYFLRPGEDPVKKITDNLFLKLFVDRQNCFIGEPLVATFKLYSRLQSRSNVVKNPGFYGFSVYDMVNVNDQIESEERFNGHWFRVHTIRKVQLYPLQAGLFTIDPMELANQVEFSRSVVRKKTEQEVSEQMYGDQAKKEESANPEVYEMNVKTNPLAIKVKSLPGNNLADTFAGAVGNFSIRAFVEKSTVSKNEENSLIIRIEGAGNFQRVDAPFVNWPPALENFEPSVIDTLNKKLVPLTGQREFRFEFLSSKAGRYTIPPISFSFFDLKTKKYRTISTKPIGVFVNQKQEEHDSVAVGPASGKSHNRVAWRWITMGTFILLAGFFFWVQNKWKGAKKLKQEQDALEQVPPQVSIGEYLAQAELAVRGEDKSFYRELNHALWDYLNYRLGISASLVNKDILKQVLTSKKTEPKLVGELIELIHQSEIGMYTDAVMNLDKGELVHRTKTVLQAVEDAIAKA